MKNPLIALSAILMVICLLSCDPKISHDEHVWGGQKVTKEATCTEEGEAVVRCSCGETKTITLEKLGHDIVEDVTEPTYLKKGRIDYKCSRCEATDLKKSFELDRLSLAGYGVEQMHLRKDDSSVSGRYYCFVFGDNNSVVCINCEGKIEENIPFSIYWGEGHYSIVEEGEKDNPKYKLIITFNDNPYSMACPIEEEDGKIKFTLTIWDGTKYEFVLDDEFEMFDIENPPVYFNGDAPKEFTDRYSGTHYWDQWKISYCNYIVWNNPCITEVTQPVLVEQDSKEDAEVLIVFQHQIDENGECVNCKTQF